MRALSLTLFAVLTVGFPRAGAAAVDKQLEKVAECAWKRDPAATARFMAAGDASRAERRFPVFALSYATGDRCTFPKFFKAEDLHAAVVASSQTEERQRLVAVERERLPVVDAPQTKLPLVPTATDMRFAACVRGSAGKRTARFLKTRPESEQEMRALKDLSSSFPKCSPSEVYKVSRQALRLALDAMDASH